MNTLIGYLRKLIEKNRLQEALAELGKLLEDSPLLDEMIHLSGRFSAIRKQIRMGTVTHAESTLTENQIRLALLELIREIESTWELDAKVKQEVGNAVEKIVHQQADKIYNIDHIDQANFS
ncbi:MAG: hypothetical protein NWR72_16830 [Bacteroidia bacterium]|nr:hypothetical protein [Bacteroidia bacterium]